MYFSLVSFLAKVLSVCLLAFGNLLIIHQDLIAQVSIAPTAVFMTDENPFQNLIVSNGSDTPQEISIDFRFGYPVSDEMGNISMHYDTTAHESSLTENINAFPRNFILDPGERQTVRIAARGFGGFEEGTYWARVAVLASPLSPPVETVADDAIAARITMNFEQIIPAFFRRGEVSTGVNLNDIRFYQDGDQGRFVFDLERIGNSPYIGSIAARIFDADGNEMMEQTSNISVYYDMLRSMTINLSELTAGDYRAEFTLQTQRRDISRERMIQVPPIQQTLDFSVE